MTDARWSDIDRDVRKACKHFSKAVRLFDQGGLGEANEESETRSLAFFHAMLSGYTASENVLLQVLDLIQEERPVGPDWHKKIIERLSYPLEGSNARPALFDRDTATDLDETLRFRHVAIHVYDSLDVNRARPAAEAARRLVVSLPDSISRFSAIIDPD
jgi:uncharacterized protein YutE (UPF0331/DUF86 family)